MTSTEYTVYVDWLQAIKRDTRPLKQTISSDQKSILLIDEDCQEVGYWDMAESFGEINSYSILDTYFE